MIVGHFRQFDVPSEAIQLVLAAPVATGGLACLRLWPGIQRV